MKTAIPVVTILLLALGGPVLGEQAKPTAPATGTASPASSPEVPGPSGVDSEQESARLDQILTLLQQQQQELASQKEQLEAQSKQIDEQSQKLEQQALQINTLTNELDVLQTPQQEAGQQVADGGPAVATVPPVTVISDAPPEPMSEEQTETEAGEAVAKAQTDDPTRALLEDFKGAWRLPGTSAALRVGGFVKTSVVYNFDPLEIKDRFIVGSIPVSTIATSEVEAESSISASQSRLNFDLREPTEFGLLRAFIEGDFAEDNDTFRLRHAFGQWKKMTAGKTWSAFVDTAATPEEVDFEGLNGRINVRQSQVRVMPGFGEKYEFQFSMEDPNPQVQNGNGVTRAPDIVMTGRFEPRERLHMKASLLGRQIRAQRLLTDTGGVEKTYAWGLALSGRFNTPRFDERDNLLFQLSAGNGIGRYINDLSSVGNFDGIFNPDNGDLELFDVIAGYASWQHWWGRNRMRSNFTFGFVDVDNPNFISGDAYKRTIRLSSNLMWSPTPRIDIGGEYLWGSRENEDGADGDAMQLQMAVRYRF